MKIRGKSRKKYPESISGSLTAAVRIGRLRRVFYWIFTLVTG